MSDAAESFRDVVRAFKVAHSTWVDTNERPPLLPTRKATTARVVEYIEASTGVKIDPRDVSCHVDPNNVVAQLKIRFDDCDEKTVERMTEFAVNNEGCVCYTRQITTTKVGVREYLDAVLWF